MVTKTFKKYDKDDSGKISKNEMKDFVKTVAERMHITEPDEQQLDNFIEMHDTDHDKLIDLGEFIPLFTEIMKFYLDKLKG